MKHHFKTYLLLLFLTAYQTVFSQFLNPQLPIKVAANGRYLEYANGKPFFWMGDTGWQLLHKLSRKDVDLYLETRFQQGFNVIQLVIMPELNGLKTPNKIGEVPILNNDLDKPNEKYFEFVDYVLIKAASLGIYIAMLPSWGDTWDYIPLGEKNLVFTTDKAFRFGKYLGDRYKNQWNIVWIMGGDRNPENMHHYEIINSLVSGLKEGENNKHLITFHPGGDCSSASFFHDEKWLDFNMTQTGHSNRKVPNYLYSLNNYCLTPVKPTIDGEPRYENIPVRFWEINIDSTYRKNPYDMADSLTPHGYFNDYDVRTAAYWSVFSGAFGHTYGNGSVWCFWEKGAYSSIAIRNCWQKEIFSSGSIQMGYLRKLIEKYGLDLLQPDRNVIVNNNFLSIDYIASLRARNGSVLLIYNPVQTKFKVSLKKITGNQVFYAWFNPRNGTITKKLLLKNTGLIEEFEPPQMPNELDWVLVLTNN